MTAPPAERVGQAFGLPNCLMGCGLLVGAAAGATAGARQFGVLRAVAGLPAGALLGGAAAVATIAAVGLVLLYGLGPAARGRGGPGGDGNRTE